MTDTVCQLHGLPVRVGSPFTMDQCRVCWLKSGGDPYAAVEEIGLLSTLPCKYRGPLVPLPDRYKLSLGVLRNWYPCQKGHSHLNSGYVCPCQGCGPGCDDYSAVTEESTP